MNCSAENKFNIKHISLIMVCVCISMLICSGCTSPLYPHYACLDSSMFLLTGRGILEGKICYAELFDHKGPVFFWLEAAGYALGGRTGVWLFQCFLAIIDILLVEKICKTLKANAFLPVISSAAIFFFCFLHGNLTEEFSMPMILLALSLEVEFFVSEDKTHNPLHAFAYGIIFGLLAFVRINNAITICVLVICIGIELIKEKQWKNIVLNFFSGALGIAVAVLPTCLYYYTHSALYEMLYATFLHNLVYAKENTHSAILSKYIINFAVMYAPGVFAAVVFAVKAKNSRKRLYLSLLTATIVTYSMLIYSNVYAHYFMLGIPVFAIAVASAFPDFELKKAAELQKAKKLCSITLLVIVVIFGLLSIYSAGAPFYKTYISGSANEEYKQISESMKSIPENERDSIIGFGVLADFYVHADVTPCYKYYTLQKWMTTENRDVYGEFIDYASEEHPLWIVINSSEKDKGIVTVLENYELVTSDDYYQYYRYGGKSK